MAIPSTPQNFYVKQANRQVLAQWDGSAGATSYTLQRSTDGVNFTTLANPTVPQYLDTAVTVGVQYWYQVGATNASGTSPFTGQDLNTPTTTVPAPTAEMSLLELRLRCKQRADRVNSNFVNTAEWDNFIDLAAYELYDLIITAYEDYFKAPNASFTSTGNTWIYPLPDGITTFQDDNGGNIVAKPLYKLLGVDLALNTANNAYVTVNKFNFMDRNKFVYPNTASTIYGVFNLQYRMLGTNMEFVPTPSAGQKIRIQYIPRLPALLADTDITTIGFSGWIQYVIARAAKYALDKEESDTTSLDSEILFLKGRIEESSVNRDAGQPDKISNTRSGTWDDGRGGFNGATGGW